jgi:hypothetical protein
MATWASTRDNRTEAEREAARVETPDAPPEFMIYS